MQKLRDLENTFKYLYSKSACKFHSFVLSALIAVSVLTVPVSAELDTDVSTAVTGWVSILESVWNVVKSNPIMLLYAGAGFLFIGFRLFKKAR